MEIVSATRELAIGWHRQAAISVVRGTTDLAALHCLRDTTARVMKAHPSHHFMLNVVEATAAKPTQDDRKRYAEVLRETQKSPNMTTVFVFEATGFGAAAVRAVIAGISFLSGQSQKTFPSLDEALAFMTGTLPVAEREAFANGVRESVAAMKQRIAEARVAAA